MFRILCIVGLLFCAVFYGQIPHEDQSPFPPDEFVIYSSFKDTLSKTLYQIGRHEPASQKFELDQSGKWTKTQVKTDENFKHIHAPGYLKTIRNNVEKFYFLNDYSEGAFYGIKKLASENLLFITTRYHFYIFDRDNEKLSEKCIPGFEQYEAEDAISGLYDAIELFDNSQYLLGNVQGFGIFCFDISNPSKPRELKQYGIDKSMNGGFYVFFVRKNENLYDVIIAQHDINSKNSNIRNYYSKLKEIRYAARDEELRLDPLGEPLISQEEHNLLFETTNRSYIIDLQKGVISVR